MCGAGYMEDVEWIAGTQNALTLATIMAFDRCAVVVAAATNERASPALRLSVATNLIRHVGPNLNQRTTGINPTHRGM